MEENKTCDGCVRVREGLDISGSTCYLCKRNPVDHRIDWFEECSDIKSNEDETDMKSKHEEKKEPETINDIIESFNDEQKEMLYYFVGCAMETGKNYLLVKGDFKQRKNLKVYESLSVLEKIVVEYIVKKAIEDYKVRNNKSKKGK